MEKDLADVITTGNVVAGREAVIEARGIRRRFGEKVALDGVDITVKRQEFVGLIGPNGAGKTTLMEILEGIQVPDAGSLEVLGRSLATRNRKWLARIGIQPQSSAFFLRSRVREHLETLADLFGVNEQRVDETLERFSLTHCAKTRVEKLSGGERQKLAVASALLHTPELVFLDEPTAGMDAESRADLVQLLLDLRDSGTTVLYTTHLLFEAERLCSRVVLLSQGHVLTSGTPASLVSESGLPSSIVLPEAVCQADLVSKTPQVVGVDVTQDGLVVQVDDPGQALVALRKR
jgi:ABC-2 type transport system ATP-binding protein